MKRTAFSGPALVRLLAHFADLDVHEPAQSLADRLSQWLGWTDAIALSTALASDPPAASGARSVAREVEEECARVRNSLAGAFAREEAAARRRNRTPVKPSSDDAPIDHADFRQRYVSLQQAMESDIGALRTRLRATLATKSPDMARLAVVDAVMEQALSARERSLLGNVPALLGKHFERLKRAQAAVETSAPNAWLDVFRKDLQSVLLAELDVRFQPIEGLLAALRPR
ncbi:MULTISPECIES: DUF3348 domain-containing protein [unclassified Caballeronia]|uniref:DUF3348 domain-containing protein n=1 Tax=unclassified Caballeronia TaxID=2646786 RepID=UPI002029082C|nr:MULTISPECIES: DUF3348 domain-containing protein [unclassified Caballeronia]MDR5767410.1 DUF3348 domain-containing protein [Caballeronia sp. LZ028]